MMVVVLMLTWSSDVAFGGNLDLKLGILGLDLNANEVKWVTSKEVDQQQQHQYLYIS